MKDDKPPELEHELIHTPRLTLKVFSAELATQIIRHQDEMVAMKTFGLDRPEDFDRFRATVLSSTAYRSCVICTIHPKASEEMIGSCNFHTWIPKHFRAEIGYALHEPYKNQGFMKEAMNYVLAYGFETMGLHRVEAMVGKQNIPSLKLMAHFGFTNEGVLRENYFRNDRFEDSISFSLLNTEYAALKADW